MTDKNKNWSDGDRSQLKNNFSLELLGVGGSFATFYYERQIVDFNKHAFLLNLGINFSSWNSNSLNMKLPFILNYQFQLKEGLFLTAGIGAGYEDRVVSNERRSNAFFVETAGIKIITSSHVYYQFNVSYTHLSDNFGDTYYPKFLPGLSLGYTF